MKNTYIVRWSECIPVGLLLVLIGIFLWMYYPQLGGYPLRDWDESIYAQVARQSSDPFAFQWSGLGDKPGAQSWFEKPPLVIWLVRLSQLVFGVDEFATRAVVPLFSIGLCVLVFLWAQDITRSRWAGVLSAGVFLIIPQFLIVSGILTYDIPVAFFICAALFFYSRREQAPGYIYAFWVAIGFGVLTKNIVGLLPLPIVFLDSVVGRNFQWLRGRQGWAGPAVCLLVFAPWHIVETIRFGSSFWYTYFYTHVLVRGTSSFENHGASFWYYCYIFKQHPFFELCMAGLVYACARLFDPTWRKKITLPLSAGLVIFVFFSAAISKIVYYIVPFYPYAALCIGLTVYWVISYIKTSWLREVLYICIVCACLAAGLQFNAYRLVAIQGPVYSDVKQIATWLESESGSINVGYQSLATAEEVIDSRPALVFYLNRWVAPVPNEEVFDLRNQIYRTRTHVVYRMGDRYVVVAVRYVP